MFAWYSCVQGYLRFDAPQLRPFQENAVGRGGLILALR